jgi:PAS domain S-box-containing protein
LGTIWGGFKFVLKPILAHFKRISLLCSTIEALTETIKRLNKNISLIQKRQQATLGALPQPIFESDWRGENISVNKSYIRLAGASEEDLLKNNWRQFIHEEDRAKVVSEWRRIVSEKRDGKITYRMASLQGKVACITVECFALIDEEADTLIGHIGVLTRHDDMEKCE